MLKACRNTTTRDHDRMGMGIQPQQEHAQWPNSTRCTQYKQRFIRSMFSWLCARLTAFHAVLTSYTPNSRSIAAWWAAGIARISSGLAGS